MSIERPQIAGTLLQIVRESRGISRKELAASLGISVETIRSYEQGRRVFWPRITPEDLWRLSKALKIENWFLLGQCMVGAASADALIEKIIDHPKEIKHEEFNEISWEGRHWMVRAFVDNRIVEADLNRICGYAIEPMELGGLPLSDTLLLTHEIRRQIFSGFQTLVEERKLGQRPDQLWWLFLPLARLVVNPLKTTAPEARSSPIATKYLVSLLGNAFEAARRGRTRREIAIAAYELSKPDLLARYLERSDHDLEDRVDCLNAFLDTAKDEGSGIEALQHLLELLSRHMRGSEELMTALTLRTIGDLLNKDFNGVEKIRPAPFTYLANAVDLKRQLASLLGDEHKASALRVRSSKISEDFYSERIEKPSRELQKTLERFLIEITERLSTSAIPGGTVGSKKNAQVP